MNTATEFHPAGNMPATAQGRSLAGLLRTAYRDYLAAEQRLKLMERKPLVARAVFGDTPDRVAALWRQWFE